MRAIKTRPRFRCAFCRHTATEQSMIRHEKICWKNPNRYCPFCKNTGRCEVDDGYAYGMHEDECYYCKQVIPELILGDSYFA